MSEQPRHVFVDASGRRAAWLRRTGWAVTVLVSAYLLLLVAALVGPPGLSRLAVPGLRGVLPEVGPAQLGDGAGGSGDPQDVLEQTGPAPTPRPTDPPTGRSGPEPGTSPGAPGSTVGATTAPAGGPTTAPPGGGTTATPSPTSTRPGSAPSTPPGQSTASPTNNGQGSGKPSATPSRRPTDRPTKGPGA